MKSFIGGGVSKPRQHLSSFSDPSAMGLMLFGSQMWCVYIQPFFSHTLCFYYSFPSLPSCPHHHRPFPLDLPSFHFLLEKSRHSGISTKHDITSYKTIMYQTSYQRWTRWPRESKKFPKAGKRIRDTFCLLPLLGAPWPSYTTVTYAEDLAEIYEDFMLVQSLWAPMHPA